jgi:hypothetical protein
LVLLANVEQTEVRKQGRLADETFRVRQVQYQKGAMQLVARKRLSWGLAAGLLLSAVMPLSACTTRMERVTCERQPYRCIEPTDVSFCELEVVATDGAACGELGLARTKRFCFVTPAHTICAHTNYAVSDQDCRITEYRDVREWRECSEGTPTFIAAR